MHAISEGMKQINNVTVDTFCRDIDHAGVHFEVEAGTTGLCKDSRAYMRLTAEDGSFFARLQTDDVGKPRGVEIAVTGCAEILSLLETLEFTFRAIADAIEENDD